MSESWLSPDALAFWVVLGCVAFLAFLIFAAWWMERRPLSAHDEFCQAVDEQLDELDRARRRRAMRRAIDGIGEDADRVFFMFPSDPVPFAPRTPSREFEPERRPAA